MRASDIKEGETYKLKKGKVGYVRVLKVLKPKADIFYKDVNGKYVHDKNPNNYIVVKCEHTSTKQQEGEDCLGFIRYFKPSDIVRL